MRNVLIVDDEYLGQVQLQHIINWENHGFTIAGICKNGAEAIEFIENNSVDLIFTDVCMPETDGIELTKYINNSHPEIIVIITSNYSDLDYVKDAFKASAFDYILKPTITSDTITELLDTVSSVLDSSKLTTAHRTNIEENDTINYTNKIINALTESSGSAVSFENSIIAVASIHKFLLIEKTHSAEEIDVLFNNVINTMSYILLEHKNFVIFRYEENTIVLFLPFDQNESEPQIMNSLYEYIRLINHAVQKFFNFNFIWGISSPSNTNKPLTKYLEEAVNMLNSNPIPAKDRLATTNYRNLISIFQERQLTDAINILDINEINSSLESIFQRPHSDVLTVSVTISELLTLVNRICDEHNIDINRIFDTFPEDNKKILNDIKTSSEGLAYSKNFFKAFINILQKECSPNKNSKLVDTVKKYIENHYQEEITLQEIAIASNVSLSHLSKIFKKETSQTLNDYITSFRINKAKQMLAQNVDIKHLYSMVGFKNYNYFFVLFKRYTGCTPKEYYKSIIKNSTL